MPEGDPLSSLPHGDGFRFLDQLTITRPGVSATTVYTVPQPQQLPMLLAHFPGNPILPGVIYAEAIAQAAGAVAHSAPNPPTGRLLLTAVQQLKIKGMAQPGDVLTIEVEITGRLGNLIQASGTITSQKKQLATAKVTLTANS